VTNPRVTNAQLAEHYSRLETQVIELAAKLERLRMDLDLFVARWTVAPPKP
jgi:hypothetical protein